MGILNSELNYDEVIKDLGSCCLTKENCGTCVKPECIVGYAQNCITHCFKNGETFIEDGSLHIPTTDFKVYNTEEFENGIAHILKQCKSCSTNHFDNCIINIIRNCYEVGLMGEIQHYEGSNFRYLNQIHTDYPELATRIIEEFHNSKE
ncbi:MAG: hypothetical protein RRX92_04390 [Lachnospiraceae bacterium]